MQVPLETSFAERLNQAVATEIPSQKALGAWQALLTAHATLLRRLETDLERETGLALADFDVLAQLAFAEGQLRMSDLAARALISRSGMTRRVARLVGEGLVDRSGAPADARGVIVTLTRKGQERLLSTMPVHARGITELFVNHLSEDELSNLESALGKVRAECNFG